MRVEAPDDDFTGTDSLQGNIDLNPESLAGLKDEDIDAVKRAYLK